MIKAALFDVDGTLTDSMPVWDNMITRYIMSLGITPEPDIEDKVRPLSFMDSCRYIIEHYNTDMTVEEMVQAVCDAVADKYRNEVEPKHGAVGFVEKLHKMGIKMALVTASERGYITDCLKRIGIYDKFDFLMTCSEEGLDKNSCRIYDRACERLGADKAEVIVFEDALHAVEALSAGGYTVYGVYDKTMQQVQPRLKALCKQYAKSFDEFVIE